MYAFQDLISFLCAKCGNMNLIFRLACPFINWKIFKRTRQKLGIIFLFYGSTMGEKLFDEAGTAILVLTQMLVSCLGIITNSLLLVAVKDFSSTYHILLANLSFCNLFVCTVLKPVTSINSGYAYAKMQHKVGLSFCQLYTFLTGTFLPFLPWSVLALSWQILLEGRTNIKFKTSTNTQSFG